MVESLRHEFDRNAESGKSGTGIAKAVKGDPIQLDLGHQAAELAVWWISPSLLEHLGLETALEEPSGVG